MSCMWGVGRGTCLKVCSVMMTGLQGFLSVYVRSIVVRGPASVSYGAKVRLFVSPQQPAGVSVKPLPATQQSVANSCHHCKRHWQKPQAAGALVDNRALASRAGGRRQRNGAYTISGSRHVMPPPPDFLRRVPVTRQRRQGGGCGLLVHVHVAALTVSLRHPQKRMRTMFFM